MSVFNILENLTKNKTEEKSTNLSQVISNELLREMVKIGCYRNVSASEAYQAYNNNPSLPDAVDMIANKFSTIIPIIENNKGEITTEHPALTFLKRPNILENYSEFAESMATNFLLNNNSYLEILGFFKSKPQEIWNVKNSAVQITESPNQALYNILTSGFFDFLKGNFLLNFENDGRILDQTNLRELYHLRGFYLSSSTLKAVSKIQSIHRDLGIVDQSTLRNLSLLRKGFSSNTLINVDTEDNEAFEQLKKDVRLKYSGAGNSGETLISKGKDIDVKSFDQTNKEMEGLKTKQESKNNIYRRYDIPRPIVESNAQTYNNYQTALYALYDNAVLPLGNRIYSAYTKIFKDRKMLSENEHITYDISSIPALQLRTTEELKALKDARLTTDELRGVVGREALQSGGDTVLVPSTLIPIGSDAYTDDNRDEPAKKFIEQMKKHGFEENEIKEFWDEYKEIIR